MPALALTAAIGTPLLLAAALTIAPARGVVWRAMPFAPLPALALALFAPETVAVEEKWLILGAVLGLDPTARLFLIPAALVWTAAAAAARVWMADDPRATGFGLCFLLAMTGNLSLFLALDAPSFYSFFALMSFSSYGLVLHARSRAALVAARLYIGFVMAGELALFAGLALAAAETGSLMLADLRGATLSEGTVALLLAGFGIKLGVMPLHFWLPPAHGAAPAPASAVLSGAMIKAGLFGIAVTVPVGGAAYADLGVVVTTAGLVTIFAALLLGAREPCPKTVLGFSSVSQMGIVALGLGMALMAPDAWGAVLPVLAFLAAHHALAKAGLFLGTGAFATQRSRTGRITVTAALLLPALILAGLPGFSGGLGKDALKSALGAGPALWLPWMTLALTLSGVATTLLMARFFVRLWCAPPAAPARVEAEALVLPVGLLALGVAALPAVWPPLAGSLAQPIAGAAPGPAWPLLAGAVLAVSAAVIAHTRRVGWSAFLASLTAPAQRAAARGSDALARRRRALVRQANGLPPALDAWIGARRLGQTGIAALLLAILAMDGIQHLVAADPATAAPPALQRGP
ncbi:Formate hydrogenlyase subunit 3/Multisubunit Na+/H+ antiporter, MnhD subunit [Rhodovulum sp. ES.010]|uniref:proton-conducting transporter transmembrane domain-containing protein n=1 Tax=Rhodovulum sp. ES.010 TaxID=1882821 RepID=UPI000929CA8C|nr:proton-conducting transporter membrane subunit [Rhodovulum sp. ES.010]SIO54671.1 Formate hydrogenlyase subunit 3/Multisubunit Na+/H+ antiporter, MnhD subunit [Rhodovulum sp. ES.010]